MIKKYVETGKIVGTHGVRGEVRVQPWADSPDVVAHLKKVYTDEQGSALDVSSARVHGNVVLMKIRGVESIEDAERLRNKTIFAARDDVLPKNGKNLIAELIGCKVYDADSAEFLGVLTDVFQTGANDVWTVSNNNHDYLVPAIKDVVISVDVAAEKIVLRPLKGIFDDEN